MKKSMLMAVSVSILLTGCLVKKSDYEAAQASHEATRQELAKRTDELENAAAQLKAKTSALKELQSELASVQTELERNQNALIEAQQAADALKAESATSSERAAELADQLVAAEKKVAEAKALFTRRLEELKLKAEAELAEANSKNVQLRTFVEQNY